MDASQKRQGLSDSAAKTIRHKARQLVDTAGFKRHDLKDIEQELRLDLLQRLPKFNPNKATHETFVARLIERKISKLIRYRTQEKRDFRRESFSLNDRIDDPESESIERISTVGQDEADIRIGKRRRSREEEAQLRVDVSLVLSGLPNDLRELAELLKTHTITQAAESLGIPRSTLYGARDRLRCIFENAGLKKYL